MQGLSQVSAGLCTSDSFTAMQICVVGAEQPADGYPSQLGLLLLIIILLLDTIFVRFTHAACLIMS